MKPSDLKSPRGANKNRKRVGRGHGSGQGKSAGRGTKGQAKRSGGTKGPYFEGGQLPLVRRLPHLRGFTNLNRVEYQPVNVGLLTEHFEAGADITPDVLADERIIRRNGGPVVILGDGKCSKPLHIHAHRFSASARQKIEPAGGTLEELSL